MAKIGSIKSTLVSSAAWRDTGTTRCNRTAREGGAFPARDGAVIRTQIVTGAQELERYLGPWRRLAADAMCASPTHDSFMTLPALHHLPGVSADVRFVLIWRDTPDCAAGLLIGLFAVQKKPWRWGVPVKLWSSWSHMYTFFAAPLVHEVHGQDALDGFFDWFGARSEFFMFRMIPGEGPLYDALVDCLGRKGLRHRLFDRHERVALQTRLCAPDYLKQTLARKHRKEYRRLRARLAEQGALSIECKTTPENIGHWIDDFYRLEAASWKGRQGTALACDENWAVYFRAVLEGAFREGKGLFWRLMLDDKPVAMAFGFTGGRQAWLGKIAHDSRFDRYSPGALLILDILDWVTRDKVIEVIDSCARSGHPLISRLWRERIVMTDMLIDLDKSAPGVRFALACAGEAARRNTRAIVKYVYHLVRHGEK